MDRRRYTGRERRQRALLRLSVILWVLVCCIILFFEYGKELHQRMERRSRNGR